MEDKSIIRSAVVIVVLMLIVIVTIIIKKIIDCHKKSPVYENKLSLVSDYDDRESSNKCFRLSTIYEDIEIQSERNSIFILIEMDGKISATL
jgi:hypothetical protein